MVLLEPSQQPPMTPNLTVVREPSLEEGSRCRHMICQQGTQRICVGEMMAEPYRGEVFRDYYGLSRSKLSKFSLAVHRQCCDDSIHRVVDPRHPQGSTFLGHFYTPDPERGEWDDAPVVPESHLPRLFVIGGFQASLVQPLVRLIGMPPPSECGDTVLPRTFFHDRIDVVSGAHFSMHLRQSGTKACVELAGDGPKLSERSSERT